MYTKRNLDTIDVISEFLTVSVVEMHCNKFVKHKMVQIHSNYLPTVFTRDVFSDSNFLVYKAPTNFSGLESSGFILYL